VPQPQAIPTPAPVTSQDLPQQAQALLDTYQQRLAQIETSYTTQLAQPPPRHHHRHRHWRWHAYQQAQQAQEQAYQEALAQWEALMQQWEQWVAAQAPAIPGAIEKE
jgi:hypothetical protein